ncbi:MAG: glycosyltransferase family 39 protein, partial [Chloroflexi bacterium]|nr:glycosyltransferase family 39 protein [Chloroflexota bacterium]
MEQLSSPQNTLDNFIISLGKRSFNISRIRLYQLTFFFLFISTFVLTRAYDLNGMPAFVDEVTHIARANRMMNTGPIISATDIGKMLHPLLLSIFFRIFSVDQLWLARAFSIFMSLLGAVGCFWLGNSISKDWWVGALACLIYSFSPFTFFHDRTALADSLLTMFGIYTLIFSIRMIRSARYGDAIITGIVVGLATLTKLYGAIFAFLPILAWIVLEKKINIRRMWRLGSVAYLAALVTVIPHFLVLGSLLDYMRGKTVKPWEPVSMPNVWSSNVGIGFSWLTGYLTPAILILAALGLVLAIRQRNRFALLVGLASGLGVLLFVLVAQRWFPRYLLIAMPGFYLLAAFAMIGVTDWIVARVNAAKPAGAWMADWIRAGVLVVLFLMAVVQSILFDYRLM